MQEYPNFNLFGSIFFIWSSKTETHISRKWRKMWFDKSIHYYLISYMAWNVLRDIEMAYFKWILLCVCIFCRNVFNYKLILLFLCLDTGIFYACVEHFYRVLGQKGNKKRVKSMNQSNISLSTKFYHIFHDFRLSLFHLQILVRLFILEYCMYGIT